MSTILMNGFSDELIRVGAGGASTEKLAEPAKWMSSRSEVDSRNKARVEARTARRNREAAAKAKSEKMMEGAGFAAKAKWRGENAAVHARDTVNRRTREQAARDAKRRAANPGAITKMINRTNQFKAKAKPGAPQAKATPPKGPLATSVDRFKKVRADVKAQGTANQAKLLATRVKNRQDRHVLSAAKRARDGGYHRDQGPTNPQRKSDEAWLGRQSAAGRIDARARAMPFGGSAVRKAVRTVSDQPRPIVKP
jgi:hypothetical protein